MQDVSGDPKPISVGSASGRTARWLYSVRKALEDAVSNQCCIVVEAWASSPLPPPPCTRVIEDVYDAMKLELEKPEVSREGRDL